MATPFKKFNFGAGGNSMGPGGLGNINPRTGQWERLIVGPSVQGWDTDRPPESDIGFASENLDWLRESGRPVEDWWTTMQETEKQANASSGLGDFIGNALNSNPMILAAPLGGALAGWSGGAAVGADVAGAAGAMGGAAGSAGGGLSLAEAAGGISGAATGATGAAGGGADWWTELGLTAEDVGMSASPWSTNPGMSDLTGGVLTDAGSTAAWTQELSKVAPNVLKQAADALKAGSPAKTIADTLGISEGAVSALGKLGATALGVYGANQQSNSLAKLAEQYQQFGAPSRERFEASMKPGFDVNSIPGYSGAVDTASKGILARLSASGGNPWGNPGSLIEANKQIISGTAMPAISEYQRLNANTGFGSSMSAALGLQTQEIGADANGLNALGYGLNALTQPKQQSLADLYKSLGIGGLA